MRRDAISPELAQRFKKIGFDLPVLRCYKYTQHFRDYNPKKGFHTSCYYTWDLFINPVKFKDEYDDCFLSDYWYEEWEKEQYVDEEGNYIDRPYINWNIDWIGIVLKNSELDPDCLPHVPQDVVRGPVVYRSEWESKEFDQEFYLKDLVKKFQQYPELKETSTMCGCEEEDEETGKLYYNPKDFPIDIIPDIISAPSYSEVIEWLEDEKGLHVKKDWTGTSHVLSLVEKPEIVVTGEDLVKTLEEFFNIVIDYIIAFDL